MCSSILLNIVKPVLSDYPVIKHLSCDIFIKIIPLMYCSDLFKR